MLAKLWAPIGFVASVTLKYLQEQWSSAYGWDDLLPEETQQKWKEKEAAINQLLAFKFDQKVMPTEATDLPQVPLFVDGGELGYGAAIFLHWKLSNGSHECVHVIVKSFVAPPKQQKLFPDLTS